MKLEIQVLAWNWHKNMAGLASIFYKTNNWNLVASILQDCLMPVIGIYWPVFPPILQQTYPIISFQHVLHV